MVETTSAKRISGFEKRRRGEDKTEEDGGCLIGRKKDIYPGRQPVEEFSVSAEVRTERGDVGCPRIRVRIEISAWRPLIWLWYWRMTRAVVGPLCLY